MKTPDLSKMFEKLIRSLAEELGLFQRNCTKCHSVKGMGGLEGSKLSAEPSRPSHARARSRSVCEGPRPPMKSISIRERFEFAGLRVDILARDGKALDSM
jgi:hypothetical protein